MICVYLYSLDILQAATGSLEYVLNFRTAPTTGEFVTNWLCNIAMQTTCSTLKRSLIHCGTQRGSLKKMAVNLH